MYLRGNPLFILLVLMLVVIGYPGRATDELTFEERVLFNLPDNATGKVYVSDDGEHWCSIVDTAGGKTVVGDRTYSPATYKKLEGSLLKFAPSTGRCGFWALKTANSIVFVVDGIEYATPSSSEGSFKWSDDGLHWLAAWNDSEDGNGVIMVDGEEVGRHSNMSWPVFSPDSDHYGYFAKDDGKIDLIIDGDRTRMFGDNIQASAPHNNGVSLKPRLFFLNDVDVATIVPTQIDEECDKGDPWVVWKGETVLATYQNALGVVIGRNYALFQGELGDQSLPTVAYQSLAASDDGSTIAWWARPDGEGSDWYCCLDDGRELRVNSEVYAMSDRITLSPDGSRVGFIVSNFKGDGDERELVSVSMSIDGVEGPEYNWALWLKFSPDSSRYTYWVTTETDKRLCVIDGNEVGLEFDIVQEFFFSLDSLHYAFIAEREDQTFLVYDGNEHLLECDSAWRLRFLDDGSLSYFARRGDDVYAIDVTQTSQQ